MRKLVGFAAVAAIAAAVMAPPAQAQSDDWRKPGAQRNCTLNGVCPKISRHHAKTPTSSQGKNVAGGVRS
jgi:hypothetical protein